MEQKLNKPPVLSRHIFWDTDYNKLDFDRYAEYAIIRVLERGTEEDIKEIMRY